MPDNLHYNTVTPLLRQVLIELMAAEVFAPFRLVGGTSLSLQRGHRESVDIDLFTDAPYDSIDFDTIEQFLRDNYTYVDSNNASPVGMGRSYYVGNSKDDSVKLDVFYTDTFIRPIKVIDGIRLATAEEIVAMKLDVVQRGGRKKDFWDLHEVKDEFSIDAMLALHEERYPYSHGRELIKNNFGMFEQADNDFDPMCLREKQWEVIKLDMLDFAGID
jgi:hypothetical protein